jgi:hypothetical protein
MLGETLNRAHAMIAAARGEDPQPYLAPLLHRLDSDDIDIVALTRLDLAEVALLQGRLGDAHADGLLAFEGELVSQGFSAASVALSTAIEAAIRLGDLDEAERLLALIAERPPGHVRPSVRAAAAHQRARLNAAHGRHDTCDVDFRYAERVFDELGYVYELADARHWYAAWLATQHLTAEAIHLATRAADTYARLRATPALTRTRGLLEELTASAMPPGPTTTPA